MAQARGKRSRDRRSRTPVRRDLEGKGLAVPELRAAVETETRNTQNGELHHQYIARLAARVVTGRLVNSGHFTIRKSGGVEARRLMRVLVEPEADRVLWLHVRVLLVPIRTNAAVPASNALGECATEASCDVAVGAGAWN